MEKLTALWDYYTSALVSEANKTTYILSTLVVMIGIYLYFRKKSGKSLSFKNAFSFLFPKKIYLHKSAIVGYKFFLIDPIVRLLFFNRALQIPISAFIFIKLQGLLVVWFGEPSYNLDIFETHPLLFSIGFGLLSLGLKELGFYFHHFLMHKVPFLWEFHKVHHSAEVLTPLTDWRNHPVDMLTMLYFSSIFLGVLQAFVDYFTQSHLTLVQIIGFNAVVFAYYSIAYHLRHTHLWLSFGWHLNHIFMSPSQHQLHHSVDTKHYDKNFGSALSLWDWAFGTLYVPKYSEKLTFGIGNDEEKEYSSVWALYYLPFKKNFNAGRMLPVLLLVGLLLFFVVLTWITIIKEVGQLL